VAPYDPDQPTDDLDAPGFSGVPDPEWDAWVTGSTPYPAQWAYREDAKGETPAPRSPLMPVLVAAGAIALLVLVGSLLRGDR
jgi:hypothetical protein